jgi:hypothetical protein
MTQIIIGKDLDLASGGFCSENGQRRIRGANPQIPICLKQVIMAKHIRQTSESPRDFRQH